VDNCFDGAVVLSKCLAKCWENGGRSIDLADQKKKRGLIEDWAKKAAEGNDAYALAVFRYAVNDVVDTRVVKPEVATTCWRGMYERWLHKYAEKNLDLLKHIALISREQQENWVKGHTPFSWLLSFDFYMKEAWFSRADREFNVTDNPLKTCRITGFPEMQSTSWKGLLRSSLKHAFTEVNQDEKELAHTLKVLFGEAGKGKETGSAGNLDFFPSFFRTTQNGDQLVVPDVITPLDSVKRTAKLPIYYSVVSKGSKGQFVLGFKGNSSFLSYLNGSARPVPWNFYLSIWDFRLKGPAVMASQIGSKM